MSFDWREYLAVAQSLRHDPKEGAQRTCLGRSYYYVFHLGLTNARRLSFNEALPSLHRKLWNWCQQHKDPVIKQLGVTGHRMHALRLDADYKDAPIPNLADEVQKQLDRAQEFERLVAKSKGHAPPGAWAQ